MVWWFAVKLRGPSLRACLPIGAQVGCGVRMLLKRVDRYVSGSFLLHFFGAACLIAALYGSFDLLGRLDDLEEVAPGRTVSILGAYYGHVMPVFLADVAPALVLVSAGMVLVRMAKARELLALGASGASLRRVVTPVFFWALLISIGVFALREALGPELIRKGPAPDNDTTS